MPTNNNVIPFRCHRRRGFHFAMTAARQEDCGCPRNVFGIKVSIFTIIVIIIIFRSSSLHVLCFAFSTTISSSSAAVHTTADLLSCYCVRFVNIIIYIFNTSVRRCEVVYTRVYIFGFALWFRLTMMMMMMMMIIIILLSLWM